MVIDTLWITRLALSLAQSKRLHPQSTKAYLIKATTDAAQTIKMHHK